MTEPIKCFLLDHGFTTQNNCSCCLIKFKGINPTNSYKKYIESDFYKSIKSKMDSGVWATECEYCKKIESGGGLSMRLLHNKDFEFNKIDTLRHLTFNVGSECNLQCRSCSPNLSSSWEKEVKENSSEKIFKKYYIDREGINPNYDIDSEDLTNIKNVHFLGGEPLYNSDTIKILEKIYNATNGDCIISMNTNSTVKLNFNKYHFLKKFKGFALVLSIDAVDHQAEFIRTGCSWSKVNSVVDYYNSYDFVHLSNHTTHSVMNIFEYKKIVEWLKEKNIKDSEMTTFVEWPPFLSYKVLTEDEKSRYKNLTNNDPELKYVYDRMNAEKHDSQLREHFFKFMETTKRIHRMDWKEYLPDLYNLMHHFA